MNTDSNYDDSFFDSDSYRLPGRRSHPVPVPPYVPPPAPPIEVPEWLHPASVMQTVVYVSQRLWKPFWAALLAVLNGNLFVHLYCQDWHLAAPGRVASQATLFAAITAVFFVVVCWREYWSRHWDMVGIVMPSVIGGVSAIVAWLAGMPGPATWIPAQDNLLAFFREGEMFFVALTTLAQIWLLVRLHLVPSHIPF